PYMQVISGTAHNALGEVEVRVYHRPGQAAFARRHLHAGIGAIEIFSRLYVPYPWPIMSIIDPPNDAAGSAGGMEYPTLVTTALDVGLLGEHAHLAEYVTVHEVGHNWFQGILASNEVEEAWLDEGVNEYADSIVMDELYGTRANLVDWFGFSADTLQIRRVADLAALPAPIATRAPAFPDSAAYADATYAKTGLALRTLENIVGVDAFRAAMRAYATEWAFRHPSGADLWSTLERHLERDLSWFVEPVFHRRGVVDLRVRKISCRDARPPAGVFGAGEGRQLVEADGGTGDLTCEVIVTNLGDVPVPVDIDLVFADGSRKRERWQGGQWHVLTTRYHQPIIEVHLDPERRILIDTTLLENSLRVEADTGTTRAAGARAQFWTQSAMQLGGL
ncbi:MAG TPA: M1 family aminopeptidase, partial [Kofleriaceae bacterium]|nr:M1 family aminopeptidase [Kofleriaceae bacterium]